MHILHRKMKEMQGNKKSKAENSGIPILPGFLSPGNLLIPLVKVQYAICHSCSL